MTQHNEEFKDKAEGAAFIAGGTAAGAAHSSTPQQPRVYRKEGILVIETEPINNLDINAFIDELR